jgi:hypothetical protein
LLHISAKASGSTTQTTPQGVTTHPGGVFAPTAGSTVSDDRLAVLPELSLTAGYQLASWCRVMVGYNFLYASQVVRASSLVGPVDSRTVPQLFSVDAASQTQTATPHPQTSSLWVQGLTAGLEFRF